MGVQKNSLTEWPDNLKDVIDWFLRVGGKDRNGNGDSNKTKLPAAVEALGDYAVAKNVLESGSIAGLYNAVCDGLRVFIGYGTSNRELDGKGIGLDTFPNFSSSHGNQVKWTWNTDSEQNSKTCAALLLGTMPLLYYGLTYPFWRCEGKGGWAQESLNGSGGSGSDQGTLKQYMEALGYKENLNNKTGKSLVDDIMKSMFSRELRTAYGPSQTHYFNFLKALQDKAPKSTPLSSSPLTSLYLISYYYITNFLYTVEPTTPATPSFAGYSGTAAMAGGAYGFNLGGSGTFMSALLA
ncbi:variant erythrocyte surface antigen-1 family protein [Babesia caballi]|uniref:Variant erythrocyte surface antigen-1 family protein n=1 Tax=Babesia caballi TaxID=5871 RepID=A0AAV4LUH3_BABCB|nr:variant erythrocyte surface antigen-1 family protein [Babesia caballi]